MFQLFTFVTSKMKMTKGKEDVIELKKTKKYIVWVTTKTEEGYSSRWYGWSKNLTFSFDEALKEKTKLQDKFYDIEILEI